LSGASVTKSKQVYDIDTRRFSPLVADPARRKTFIRSAVRFLRQYNFDGLDLDWEYPAARDGGRPEDRKNYAIFVKVSSSGVYHPLNKLARFVNTNDQIF
jgi:hypothetical protein